MVKWKQVLKRPFCITLCSALVITSGNFTVPGMAVKASAEENKNFILNPSSGDIASNGAITGWYQNNEAEVVTGCADNVSFVKETVEKQDVTIPEKGTNILDNPSFNTDTQGWFATGGDLEYYAGDSEDETGGCVKVTNRTNTWNSLAQNIESKVKNNTKYYFSCWVKLSDEYDGETEVKAGLTTQSTGDIGNNGNIGGEAYDNWGISNNIIKASKDEWREIKGSFMANWTGELQKAEFKVADESSTKSFYVDNLSIIEDVPTVEKPDVTIPEKGTNILDNPSFNTDTQGWFATGGDLEYYAGDSEDETGGCVKVTNRTNTWNSLAQNIESKVKNNTKYYFSCWVKLSDEYDGETEVKAGLTTQSTGDIGNNGNIGGEAYDNWGISNNIIKASKDEWREIKGSFMANWTGELQKAEFKVADEKSTKSFYVDNLSIKENDADLSIEKDIPSLKDYFVSVNPDYDFRVGTELTADQLYNENKMALVYKHFNSFTAGNEMKPGYIIKGINDDGSLNLDFTIPDTTLDVFWNYNQDKAEKDQIHIRGHVLCWHSQTPECFFKDTDGNLLDKEAMNARIEEYIQKVLGHVNEKYPGLVYCWDVVNEAIIPSDGEKGGLRVYDGNGETFYHKIYKDSNEYIIHAFKSAAKYAADGVKLFYNDYGETEPTKVKCISALADAINAGGGRIDGIGMQAHYSMESPSAEELYNAITEYDKHVSEVQITELDMLASKSYDGSDAQKEAEQVKQAYRYKEFVDTILKAKDDGANITALVFWGVSDDDSWLVSPEFSDGRHNMPLLFDENLKAKPAYWAIVDPSRLSPNINEADVLESSSKDWSLAAPVKIGTDGKASMKLLWNSGKLYAQVTVKDETDDADDKVTIYLDKNNTKAENIDGVEIITIKRNEAAATVDGYVAEKEIDITGKNANAKLGFDVVVYDAAASVSQCWNDFQMKQDERSKYYGTLILKPFMVITKGSAIIDGKIDSAWNNVPSHNLTVTSNPSVSTTGNVKTMWDEDYLYVLANIQDAVLNNNNPNEWEQDSFEIFVDENNGKTSSYEDDDCQYRISYKNELSFNGKNCNAKNIQSAVNETENGYIVEVKIKFNKVKGVANNLIGIDFQINDADASGKRVASINWYDASGMGYAQPAVFGTAKLVTASTVPTIPPETKKPWPVIVPPYQTATPVPEVTPAPSSTPVPVQSTTPAGTVQPSVTQTPSATQTPGTTTEVIKDNVTGAVTEITTTIENGKTIVIEKVTLPGNIQNIKETVTENVDGLVKTTEKLSSSLVNAVMITNKTSKMDGAIVESDSVIYTGISDINSNYSAKVKIPESFMLNAKKADVDIVDIYIEKPTVDAVKTNQGRKMVVKIAVPSVEGVSVGKVVITKESISGASGGARKLVVKVENAKPSESYTVTIPQSELAKMSGDIDITVNTKKVYDASGSIKKNVEKILAANNVIIDNSYIVSIAGNKTKGGIKVSSPVLASSVKAGDSVYVYCYNKKTGKLEEIANNKRIVLNDGMAGIEGYPGNDYIITDKELSGKNIITLLGSSKVTIKNTSVKKGSSTKINIKLPLQLIAKTGFNKNMSYGKQAAVITYKSSDKDVAKVSKNGTIKAKGKGKTVITVKIKLEDGRTKTVKKKITVK